MGIITVSIDEDNKCFYHVMGDSMKYYDLDSITKVHQDILDYIEEHGIELITEMLRQKELMGANEKY